MRMKRLLSATIVAAAGIVLAGIPGLAPAQAYPTKTVTIINPFAAGGSLDVMARLLAEQMTQSLGQPVVVENRPGAGSTIGTALVARARPDGYTLLITAANIVSAPALGAPVNYDWKKDFAPVTKLGNIAQALAVPEDLPAKTMKEFVALAKSTPGGLSVGSLGPGSGGHINGKRLEQVTGVALTDIPFKGMAETMTALAGGTSSSPSGTCRRYSPINAVGEFGPLRSQCRHAPNSRPVFRRWPSPVTRAWPSCRGMACWLLPEHPRTWWRSCSGHSLRPLRILPSWDVSRKWRSRPSAARRMSSDGNLKPNTRCTSRSERNWASASSRDLQRPSAVEANSAELGVALPASRRMHTYHLNRDMRVYNMREISGIRTAVFVQISRTIAPAHIANIR